MNRLNDFFYLAMKPFTVVHGATFFCTAAFASAKGIRISCKDGHPVRISSGVFFDYRLQNGNELFGALSILLAAISAQGCRTSEGLCIPPFRN